MHIGVLQVSWCVLLPANHSDQEKWPCNLLAKPIGRQQYLYRQSLETLCGATKKVEHDHDDRKNQKDVNEKAGDMENKESTDPQEEENNSDN